MDSSGDLETALSGLLAVKSALKRRFESLETAFWGLDTILEAFGRFGEP